MVQMVSREGADGADGADGETGADCAATHAAASNPAAKPAMVEHAAWSFIEPSPSRESSFGGRFSQTAAGKT